MSIYTQFTQYQTKIFNQTTGAVSNLATCVKQIYDKNYSTKHTAAQAIITQQEKNTHQKYLLAIVILSTLALLFIKALSYVYIWPFHIATLAWTQQIISILGLPLLGYISIPVALYMSILLLHVIQLPENNTPYTPSKTTIIGYAIALVAPLLYPILFHLTIVSTLCLMTWTQISKKTNYEDLEMAKNQTITTTNKFHYAVISSLLLFHSSHVLLRSFSITAAMVSSPISTCVYLAIIGLTFISGLLLPQYCYSLPPVTRDIVKRSIQQEIDARKIQEITNHQTPLVEPNPRQRQPN